MALYADGHGKFEQEYSQLWDALVPKTGYAETLQGELVRLIGCLSSEFYRNGNINWTWKNDNSYYDMARRLQAELCTHFTDENDVEAIQAYMYQIIQNGITGCLLYLDGEDQYDKITDYVVLFCQQNAEPIANNCPKIYCY